jgi:hypothetical protein
MKTQITLGLSLIAGLFFSLSANAQKTTIKVAELPAKAQTFLKKHFGTENPTYVIKEKETFSTDYKVQFANKIEVEFDGNGDWDEVDGNHNAIPTAILPATIASYVKTNFKDSQVTGLDKGRWGYEVNLNNGLELEFDSNGKFIRIDD